MYFLQIPILFLLSEACTEIRVEAEDSSVVIARSMEYQIDMQSNIIVEPKFYAHKGWQPDNCAGKDWMAWKNKYKIQYLDGFEMSGTANDGQNEAGLSASCLMFDPAVFEEVPVEKCNQALSHMQFVVWVLGTFGTTKELRDAMEKDSFPIVWYQTPTVKGAVVEFPIHFSVHDRTGESIVIEWTEKGRTVFDNTVGVVTNSPPYDFHMQNIRNYVQLSNYNYDSLVLGKDTFNQTGKGSGVIGLPGDYTPPSRLVRVAVLKSFSSPAKTSEEAVNMAFHLMNSVDITHGVVMIKEGGWYSQYTLWITIKDLSKNIIYYRRYDDQIVRMLNLDTVEALGKVKLRLNSAGGGPYYDVTKDLKPVNSHNEL